MYNWKAIAEYYHEQVEKNIDKIQGKPSDTEYNQKFYDSSSVILRLSSLFSSSDMWESLRISSGKDRLGSSIPSNIAELLSCMFLGLATSIHNDAQFSAEADAIQATIDIFGDMPEDNVRECLNDALKGVAPNMSDILREFVMVASKAQRLGFMESIKVMYFTGLMLGNSFVWASMHPEKAQSKEDEDVYSPYINFLRQTFEQMEDGGGNSFI